MADTPQLFAVRLKSGAKTGFLSGDTDDANKPKIVKSPYDALYYTERQANMLADGIEKELGWETWLVPAPEGSELEPAI